MEIQWNVPNVIFLPCLFAISYNHIYICLETISSTIYPFWESGNARADIEMKLNKYILEENKFKSNWFYGFLTIICAPEQSEFFENICFDGSEITFAEASQFIKNNQVINELYLKELQETYSNDWVLEKIKLEENLTSTEPHHLLLKNCLLQHLADLVILIGLITLETYSLMGRNDIKKYMVISGLTLLSTYFLSVLWFFLPFVLNFVSDKIFPLPKKQDRQKESFHSASFCVLTHSVIWIYIYILYRFKAKTESLPREILDKQDTTLKNNTKQIKREFTCIICLKVMKAPLQIFGCSSDHLMCSKCVSTVKKCPKCKEDFNKMKPNRRLTSERLLVALF